MKSKKYKILKLKFPGAIYMAPENESWRMGPNGACYPIWCFDIYKCPAGQSKRFWEDDRDKSQLLYQICQLRRPNFHKNYQLPRNGM